MANEPVLVVKDKGGFLIHVGDPTSFNKKLLGEYAQKGYKITTISIEKYRKNIGKWKWYWERKSVSGSDRSALPARTPKTEGK